MKSRKQSVILHRQRLTYRKWHVWMRLNEASVLTADRSFGSRRIICVRSEPPGSAPPDGFSDCAVCCCNSAAGRRRVAGGGCADTAESCSPARSAACGRSPATDQRERSWHTERTNITLASKLRFITWSSMHPCYLLKTPLVLQMPPSFLACMYVPNIIQWTVPAMPK